MQNLKDMKSSCLSICASTFKIKKVDISCIVLHMIRAIELSVNLSYKC